MTEQDAFMRMSPSERRIISSALRMLVEMKTGSGPRRMAEARITFADGEIRDIEIRQPWISAAGR